MSSSGVSAINSGPLIIRTYNDNSVNNTYVLGKYDIPISSNRVLITSTNGLVAPSDNITVSSIKVSTILDKDGTAGTAGEVLHTDGATIYWAPTGAGSGYWSENGNNIFNNNTGGNVGIGTINPLVPLDVNGILRVGNQTGNTSSFEINLGTNGVGSYRSAYIYSDGNNMTINNQQNGTFVLATNNTIQISMLPSGNVGIGTTTPTEQLSVLSTILIKGPENGASRLILGPSPGTNNYDYCSLIQSINKISSDYSSDLRLYTHGSQSNFGMPTEHMRIDDLGNVSIFSTLSLPVSVNKPVLTVEQLPGAYSVLDEPFNHAYMIKDINNAVNMFMGVDTTNNSGYIQAVIPGSNKTSLVLNPQLGNVGINNTNPQYALDVSGNCYISSGLTLNGTVPSGYGALKIVSSIENAIFIQDGTGTSPSDYNGYLVGTANGFGGNQSTFVIGRIDGNNDQPNKALYLTQSGKVGIGITNPQAFLHIVEPTTSQVFTTFGTNTIVIPQGVISVSFEIIGAGGPTNEPYYTTSGAGGYIKGTINTTTLTSSGPVTLTINIGSVTNGNNNSPSGASYISNGSELLVIAGAGGAFGGAVNTSGMGVPIQGGGGGGGTWTPVTGGFVSDGLPGGDSGNTTSPIVVGGHGGGGTGLTGGTAGLGGIAGGAGLAGASQIGISPNYSESGGASSSGIGGGAGGNGFSGGGSSGYGLFNSSSIGDTGAGGGGSSYYNGTYITIINSLNGADYSQSPIISNNYGLAGNGGYAVLSYISGEPSLITEGSVGIRTTNPQASLDIKGTLSTLSIIDNNGASGTSGQVLTAGTGGQVVWGSSPLQRGTAQFDNPNVQQTITTSYTLTSNSIIQLSWYNDNNANCQNPIYTISGSDYVKQVWWNLSGSSTQFQIEIGPVPADVGKYHLIKWALLSL